MEVKEKLAKLREKMAESGIDFYLMPTADFHESEYAGEHFGVRKYMSGFTGSAGSLLVGKDKAALRKGFLPYQSTLKITFLKKECLALMEE